MGDDTVDLDDWRKSGHKRHRPGVEDTTGSQVTNHVTKDGELGTSDPQVRVATKDELVKATKAVTFNRRNWKSERRT